ncbi:putative aspergillopepsin [Melanomma pulvis-pyrius CBS 109.77]|uniref:Putative aspergillopepsin n=1 Tax=Melanomma pulvis-pyrius CBS 109.77 TaxID=1314802 RepID=A0A6A6XQB4_9PLEO|nr:putative aspergillopepsin [Melanomma pulvis-pyrius CBS 109.77]
MASSAQPNMPQATGAVPINPSPVTPEQRLEYTRRLLESITFAQPMAPDFDPVAATPEQLRLHGLPPRPAADLAPEQFAKWEKLVTELKGKELIRPTFKIIQRDETSRPAGRPEAKKWTTKNWAGAVIAQSVFTLIHSNWTVPLPEAGQGDHDVWYSSAYVGLDGYQTNSNDVLAGGTGHDYYKADGGSSKTYAWYQWYPAYPVELVNFPVNPGNRVWCEVWSYLPQNGQTGAFSIYNSSTGKYASFSFSAPAGVQLLGDSAEWVVEGEDPEANFHLVEFDDCWALKTNGYWYNLSSATTVASTCDDGTVCTAEITNTDTLVVTYKGKGGYQ